MLLILSSVFVERELDPCINYHKSKAYSSINGGIRWLGLTASPFCALLAGMYLQLDPSACVAELCRRAARRRESESLGKTVSYNVPHDHTTYSSSTVMSSNSGCSDESGELCYRRGLLIAPLA